MTFLRNWDNKTWLSSKKYIYEINKFLNLKVRFKKKNQILDIGCGRANIIGALQEKYKFNNKPLGVDIVKSKGIKKNIIFEKADGVSFLRKNKKKFDLILIKQSIHFFSVKKLLILLDYIKKSLKPGGKLIILTLNTKNNKIPCFKLMKQKLEKSLRRDEHLLNIIRKRLKKIGITNFNFNVKVSKRKYLKMIKSRYISCLLTLKVKEIQNGISELNSKYKNQIKFTDTLKCVSYKK